LRTADFDRLDHEIPQSVSDFLARIAEYLGATSDDEQVRSVAIASYAQKCARDAIRSLRSEHALAVLVVLAPDYPMPYGVKAADVPRISKAAVKESLPRFCVTVLRKWEAGRLIRDAGRSDPNEIPDDPDVAYLDHPAGDEWNFPD
jgi:hypothetical protein